MDEFFTSIERHTEAFLTLRKAKKAAQLAARKPRTFWGEVRGWIDAIVFAVFAVLLINQYLFQLFVIPTPSMVPTLLVGDRVFVNKTSYGIELYPTGPKIWAKHRTPQRDQIITFYNPDYDSRGPFYDILTQVLYMGTFSLVNIDVDADGNPRERLYVKRAVGMSGDVVRLEDGNVLINPAGTTSFIKESQFRADNTLVQTQQRLLEEDIYPGIRAWGTLAAYQEKGLASQVPAHVSADFKSISGYNSPPDAYQAYQSMNRTLRQLDPSDFAARSASAHYENGIYVPKGYVLPMGDNRDNSYDGRYFGPVPDTDVNGRVVFRFWPLNRMKNLANS